jgi:hypothetical protein
MLAFGLFAIVVLASAPTAFAWNEYNAYPNVPPSMGGTGGHASDGHIPCQRCHGFTYGGTITPVECNFCHGYLGDGASNGKGPHGGYLTTTDRCASCHTVHSATTGSYKLLPSTTVTSSCNSCHDGTGGHGVYGTLQSRGVSAAASHSIDATNVIPGGSGVTGGDRTQTFVGAGNMLGCNDCHSPHDQNTVAKFAGDRQRTTLNWNEHVEISNKLLRKRPTGASIDTPSYGSDWCLACHNGRASGGMTVVNHPVDSVAKRSDAFTYSSAAILSTDAPTGTTVIGPIGGWNRTPHVSGRHGVEAPDDYGMNRGYLMPFPRTTQQAGHYPICQQCHEDSRDVGTLSANGTIGDAAAMRITSEDGSSTTDNPRFQNFPHETENAKMLVETGDNLCMNCHPPAVLP